MPKKVV